MGRKYGVFFAVEFLCYNIYELKIVKIWVVFLYSFAFCSSIPIKTCKTKVLGFNVLNERLTYQIKINIIWLQKTSAHVLLEDLCGLKA